MLEMLENTACTGLCCAEYPLQVFFEEANENPDFCNRPVKWPDKTNFHRLKWELVLVVSTEEVSLDWKGDHAFLN